MLLQYYESQVPARNEPMIFLAGPTVRGSEQADLVSWRREAVDELFSVGYTGVVAIPEFTEKTKRHGTNLATNDLIDWEYEHMCEADVILIWIPRTERLIGLTTNFEMGYWIARDQAKCVYGRPDEALSIAYTDNMWLRQWKRTRPSIPAPIYRTLEETIYEASCKANMRRMIKDANPTYDFRKE